MSETDDEHIPLEILMSSMDNGDIPEWLDDAATRGGDSELIGATVVDWRTLPDEQAGDVWAQLGGWVDWYVHRFEIPDAKIPRCWYRHGVFVEELTALHQAHRVSFDVTDSGLGPLGWLERRFAAQQRMGTAYHGECVNGHQSNFRRSLVDDGDGEEQIRTESDWAKWTTKAHGDTRAD